MRVQEIAIHSRLVPQKVSARDTPHATIEPNTSCNIHCPRCYCIDEAVTKPLSQVRGEIDLAISKRNLDALSLLGGEPTLHPDIVEIVRYVKQKGLICELFTNGVRFLADGDTALLDALVAAGVDRFFLHIDQGTKHAHGDVELARRRMFDMLDARRTSYSLSLTLFPRDADELPAIVREHARHPYFDGIFCTLARDIDHVFDDSDREPAMHTSMASVYRAIAGGLHIEPSAYLPSSTDDDEVCWLMYFYYVNSETGATFEISPEIHRGTRALFRAVKGHHFFAQTLRPDQTRASLAVTSSAELALHPARARALAHLLEGSHRGTAIRFQYLLVQQPPRFDRAHGKVQICFHCPDAAIRNGKLTPVCVAGRVNPLGGGAVTAPPEVVREIFTHLGEAP